MDGDMRFLLRLSLLYFFLNPALADNSPYLNIVFHTMKQCYEIEDKTGVELAKCISNKLENLPNPQDYRVNLYMSSFNKLVMSRVDLYIYNQNGYRLHCTGSAQFNLVINSCISGEGNPLTPGQSLSINPPSSF